MNCLNEDLSLKYAVILLLHIILLCRHLDINHNRVVDRHYAERVVHAGKVKRYVDGQACGVIMITGIRIKFQCMTGDCRCRGRGSAVDIGIEIVIKLGRRTNLRFYINERVKGKIIWQKQ